MDSTETVIGAPRANVLLLRRRGLDGHDTSTRHRALLDRLARQAHDNIVRGCLREANGNEFKHTGDGIAAWFSSELDAMSCSLEVQRRLAHFNVHHLGEPLRVRIGLSFGEVVIDSADQPQGWPSSGHGASATLLTPIRSSSRTRWPGVLRDRFRFAQLGEVVLKGFTEPEVVHLATPSSSDGA